MIENKKYCTGYNCNMRNYCDRFIGNHDNLGAIEVFKTVPNRQDGYCEYLIRIDYEKKIKK